MTDHSHLLMLILKWKIGLGMELSGRMLA
jgi:hypothetical protein